VAHYICHTLVATCVLNTADCTPVVRVEAPSCNKGPLILEKGSICCCSSQSTPLLALLLDWGSLFCLSLCLLPSALLVVLFVLSVALLHVLPSLLSVAPLLVCQFVLSVALSVPSPALSVLCVAPLTVLTVCLSIFSDLAGSLNNITDFPFVLGLAKVFFETSLLP